MSQAAEVWAQAIMASMNGETGVEVYSYVESDLYASEGVPYFSSKIELSSEGTVAKIHGLGDLVESEKKLLAEALPALKK